MKKLLPLVLFLLSTTARAQDFDLTIDGKKLEISPGQQTSVQLQDGKTVSVLLERKKIVRYEDDLLTFSYPGVFSVSKKQLSEHTDQLMLASAGGTLLLVQEYRTLDPSSLIETLFKALTKNEISYGYKVEKTPLVTLSPEGKKFEGITALLTLGVKKTVYTIQAYGFKDSGVVVVTRIGENEDAIAKELTDEFWKSVTVKLGK